MKCVVFFMLRVCGSGDMTELLAICLGNLCAGALVQLSMQLIKVLVF